MSHIQTVYIDEPTNVESKATMLLMCNIFFRRMYICQDWCLTTPSKSHMIRDGAEVAGSRIWNASTKDVQVRLLLSAKLGLRM